MYCFNFYFQTEEQSVECEFLATSVPYNSEQLPFMNKLN